METDNMATAADTPYAPRLLDALPAELLFRIARHLSTTEYCALRLSCRTVERALYHPFSREFFTRKQFMISDFSLQALVDIAQHPHLSERLEHVSFGLDISGINMARTISQRRYHAAALADQNRIFASGRAVELLTEAFSRLRNLKTISIRDFNSRTRFRDFNSGNEYWNNYGPQYWNSYGFPTQLMNTGHKQGLTMETESFLADVFSAVSAAVAKSGARPENLELLLQDRRSGLRDASFGMPPRPHDQDIVKRVLSGLRKLHLCIAIHHHQHDSLQLPSGGPYLRANPPVLNDEGLMVGINCNRYIAHTAPSLEWLRINFYVLGRRDEAIDGFMTFFTNPTNSKNLGDRIVYPKLKRLDLGHAYVAPSSLCSMLEGLPGVEILSLFYITLVSTKGSIPMLWQAFLRKLPVILPKLKRVDINSPRDKIRRGIYDIVLEPAYFDFSIQVGDGENVLDECTKVAAKLKYYPDDRIPLDNDEDGDYEEDFDEQYDDDGDEDDDLEEEEDEDEEDEDEMWF